MGKNDHARLPSVNKTIFDKGNWQAFTAVVKYIEDLTVWAATTKEKGEDNKKYNLLWMLPRTRKGEGGRGEMDKQEVVRQGKLSSLHRSAKATMPEQQLSR